VLISWEFFFAGPGVLGGLIALCVGIAVIGLYRTDQHELEAQQLVRA
jgi:hypothetical protein